ACPSSYLLLMSAMPPPLYATALALAALLLVLSVRLGRSLERGLRARGGLVLWGALAGLALWTHLMTASVVLACAVFLLLPTPRPRPRALRVRLAWAALARAAARAGGSLVDPASRRAGGLRPAPVELLRHAAATVLQLPQPLFSLMGGRAPWVADVGAPLARTP